MIHFPMSSPKTVPPPPPPLSAFVSCEWMSCYPFLGNSKNNLGGDGVGCSLSKKKQPNLAKPSDVGHFVHAISTRNSPSGVSEVSGDLFSASSIPTLPKASRSKNWLTKVVKCLQINPWESQMFTQKHSMRWDVHFSTQNKKNSGNCNQISHSMMFTMGTSTLHSKLHLTTNVTRTSPAKKYPYKISCEEFLKCLALTRWYRSNQKGSISSVDSPRKNHPWWPRAKNHQNVEQRYPASFKFESPKVLAMEDCYLHLEWTTNITETHLFHMGPLIQISPVRKDSLQRRIEHRNENIPRTILFLS